ncbi:MAG: hypothetical protein ACXVW9_15915 [Nocardioidaceae bacterium]
MPKQVRRVARWLASQDRAVANAREASTALARQRVETEEVRMFLEGLAERGRQAHTA